MVIPLNMPKKRLSSKIPSLLVLILIGPFLQMVVSLQTSYNSKKSQYRLFIHLLGLQIPLESFSLE